MLRGINLDSYYESFITNIKSFFIFLGLSTEMKSRGVDLIILEGMGRSLHTNLHARLAVDSLKLAVVKNAWLAERLGGPLFSVIFIFEEKLIP